MKRWIIGFLVVVLMICLGFLVHFKSVDRSVIHSPVMYSNDVISEANRISADFLLAMKYEEDGSPFVEQLAALDEDELAKQLDSETKKLAFWLNIYNAYTLYLARKHTSMLTDQKIRFFTNKLINIAGQELSFDDVENGIIRHSKMKISLGYLNKLWAGRFEKRFRMNKADWRIHFALNCGAKSCPPVAFYSPERLEEQLEMAARGYLEQDVRFDEASNTVHVSSLMLWFKGDFGSRKGILSILKRFELIPQDADPKIKYNAYDWGLDLDNFVE